MLLSSSIDYLLSKYQIEKAIDIMSSAGFDAMDFSFGERYCNPETDGINFKEHFLNMKSLAQEKGLCFNQAHAPTPSSHADPLKNQKLFENIVRSIRNASYLGIPIIVVHPVQHLTYANEGIPEQLFEMNMNFYKSLEPYCEEYNIKIAVENMWQYNGKKIVHSTCSRPQEFNQYIDELNSPWFVGCFDTGHAFLVCETPAEFIRSMGSPRLHALHVHDVDGIVDSHTLPYQGLINWDTTMKALAEIGYKGDLTYEAGGFLSRTPVELYSSAMRHMAETGRYLIRKFQDYTLQNQSN